VSNPFDQKHQVISKPVRISIEPIKTLQNKWWRTNLNWSVFFILQDMILSF